MHRRGSVALIAATAALTSLGVGARLGGGTGAHASTSGLSKIKHVVIIMQENRSFDSYFGTFPGADGLRMRHGRPTACVPDPDTGGCVRPFHDIHDIDQGGPHGAGNAFADIDRGSMDGFVTQAEASRHACSKPKDLLCGPTVARGVMGYHDRREIPNYWTYAEQFVLQDHMFEPTISWTLPEHLFLVSGWSARCRRAHDPMSCVNALQFPPVPIDTATGRRVVSPDPGEHTSGGYGWTDITWLLHRHRVSWGYYVVDGQEPDCANGATTCQLRPQHVRTGGTSNPLPSFDTVKEDGELGNVQPIASFFAGAAAGSLPAVSWVTPSNDVSEHPPASVSAGQAYVTSLVNAIMSGPDWSSTAIFVSWDDWGGFYDHVRPPRVDRNGYGLRVPGLVISAYARRGYIDHQVLSHDAYLKFIEDVFLHGARIDPKTDGRPDRRPRVRERARVLGDLRRDFDFRHRPRRPLLLPPHPVGLPVP